MANAKVERKAEHVTTGNIFADLGFSAAEAQELTIKSDLHIALLEAIRTSKKTQSELAQLLNVHQPDVSNLLRGKLHLFSITKLCQYAALLGLSVRIEIAEVKNHAARMHRTSLKKKPVSRRSFVPQAAKRSKRRMAA